MHNLATYYILISIYILIINPNLPTYNLHIINREQTEIEVLKDMTIFILIKQMIGRLMELLV